LLTVRLPGLEARSPLRVVVDPFARTPPAAALLEDAARRPVTVLVSEKAPRHRLEALAAKGARVNAVASDYRGRFDPREVLRVLGVAGVKSVLLEGGAVTARAFIEAQAVDRIALFQGAGVVGADGIRSPVAPGRVPPHFTAGDAVAYGEDRLTVFERNG
jgi:diaminohydroxyphosphoribosylaminopyrimidine deaminase/5-amino-6-(5-phosphoribosylamino)uracil reductase